MNIIDCRFGWIRYHVTDCRRPGPAQGGCDSCEYLSRKLDFDCEILCFKFELVHIYTL